MSNTRNEKEQNIAKLPEQKPFSATQTLKKLWNGTWYGKISHAAENFGRHLLLPETIPEEANYRKTTFNKEMHDNNFRDKNTVAIPQSSWFKIFITPFASLKNIFFKQPNYDQPVVPVSAIKYQLYQQKKQHHPENSTKANTRTADRSLSNIFNQTFVYNTDYRKLLGQSFESSLKYSTLNYLFFDRVMNTLQTQPKMNPVAVMKHAYKDIWTLNFKQTGLSFSTSAINAVFKNVGMIVSHDWIKHFLDAINIAPQKTNHKIASFFSGVAATAATYPIASAKQRFLSGQSFHEVKSLKASARYAGLPLTFLRNGIHSFIYFETKAYLEKELNIRDYMRQNGMTMVSPDMVIATCAGVLASFFTTPIANIVTNQKVLGLNADQTLKIMIEKNGVRSLWQSGFFAAARLVTEAYFMSIAQHCRDQKLESVLAEVESTNNNKYRL